MRWIAGPSVAAGDPPSVQVFAPPRPRPCRQEIWGGPARRRYWPKCL